MFAESEKRQEEAMMGGLFVFTAIMIIGMLTQSMLVISSLVFLVSLPAWIPYFVVRLRFIIFEKINGEEGVQIPSDKYDDKLFMYLYNHPDVNLRSKQKSVGLSDFFWYLLAPAHFIHQEHLESDSEKYQILKQVTTNIIQRPQNELIKLIEKYIEPLFDDIVNSKRPKIVHLRHFFFTAFLKIFYELTFGEEIKDEKELKIIYDSANDVITALKFVKTRDMECRHKFTKYLFDKLNKEHNGTIDKHFSCDINNIITNWERALFLQGVIFTTGTVQISEAMAHLCVTLAQHSFGDKKTNLDAFISEMFRVFPLFGIAHRITSQDIKMPNSEEILFPKGTVLCFNYPEFHRRGYRKPNTFNFERWHRINKKTANFIPFGAKQNRPCPAQHISMVWMKKCAQMMVDKVEFHTSILHTRSMPDGGLCLIVPKSYYLNASKINKNNTKLFRSSFYCKSIMTSFYLHEQFMNVTRSVIQLICGAYMLQDAKKKKLAKTWVEENEKKKKLHRIMSNNANDKKDRDNDKQCSNNNPNSLDYLPSIRV